MKSIVNIKEYFSYQNEELTKECELNYFMNTLQRMDMHNLKDETTLINISDRLNIKDIFKNGFNIKDLISYYKTPSILYFGAGVITTSLLLFTFNVINTSDSRVERLAIKTEYVDDAIEKINSIDSFN